jgi:hypothetical protein
METKYEMPTIKTIGSVQDLTEKKPNKCGGSGDLFLPNLLTKNLTTGPCP